MHNKVPFFLSPKTVPITLIIHYLKTSSRSCYRKEKRPSLKHHAEKGNAEASIKSAAGAASRFFGEFLLTLDFVIRKPFLLLFLLLSSKKCFSFKNGFFPLWTHSLWRRIRPRFAMGFVTAKGKMRFLTLALVSRFGVSFAVAKSIFV